MIFLLAKIGANVIQTLFLSLALLPAFLLAGCAGKTAAKYDLPLLIKSDFATAQNILGPAENSATTGDTIAPEILAGWNFSDGAYCAIFYSQKTKWPNRILFGKRSTDQNPNLDKESFLQLANLKMDDPQYKVEILDIANQSGKVSKVIVEPTTISPKS